MLGQKANAFTNTDGTVIPRQVNITTVITYLEAKSRYPLSFHYSHNYLCVCFLLENYQVQC